MEVRQLHPDEYKEAIVLADAVFRDEEHESMGVSFPQVFSKEMKQSFGAFIDDKLVSFIGLVPNQINIDNAVINVFSIGAVCTHKDYRKQGISSAILKEVYEYIDRAEGTLLFVSGNRGLYERNDCYPFGNAYRYKIDKVKGGATYQGIIRKGEANDLLKIHQLYEQKDIHFKSTAWEWATLFEAGGFPSGSKMRNHLFIAENKGKIDGYVALALPNEKSTRDDGLVMDVGGSPERIREIFEYLLQEKVIPSIEYVSMWHEDQEVFMDDYSFEEIQNSGTIYVINTKRLFKQLRDYFEKLDDQFMKNIKVEEDGALTMIRYKGQKIELSKKELVSFLFTKQIFTEDNPFREILPIPLPYTVGLHYV